MSGQSGKRGRRVVAVSGPGAVPRAFDEVRSALAAVGLEVTVVEEREPFPPDLLRLERSADVVLVGGAAGSGLPLLWLGPPEKAPRTAFGAAADPQGAAWAVHRFLQAQWASAALLGGVLVGGSSRRMGRPKATLRVGGRSLAERVVAAMATVVDEVVLLGEGPVPEDCAHLRRLTDAPGVRGPMGAMLAAFHWDPGRSWLFAPCDLPRVSTEALRWLVGERRPGRWAILPAAPQPEPLLAVYEPPIAEALEALAATGAGPSRLVGRSRVVTPRPPGDLLEAWTDVDTPADLQELGP